MIHIRLIDIREPLRLEWKDGRTWTFNVDGTITVSDVPLPPVDDASVSAYEATKKLLRVVAPDDQAQAIAATLYHVQLNGDASHQSIRYAMQRELLAEFPAYIQLVRDGNIDDLKGVVKAMDEWLKMNGKPGVV